MLSRLSFDILIPPDQIMGARMGFVVVVELTQRPTRRTKAVGKIVEVLGDNMGTGMAVDIALRTHEIPYMQDLQVVGTCGKRNTGTSVHFWPDETFFDSPRYLFLTPVNHAGG